MSVSDEADKRRRVYSFLKFVLATFATKMLMTAMRLLRNAIIARVLGPTLRGVLALINELPELIIAAANFGYPTAMAYAAAQKRYPMRAILSSILLFVALVGGLLALLTLAVLHLDFIMKDQAEQLTRFAPLIALAVPLLMFKLINNSVLAARMSITEVNLLRILESALPLIFFLLLWWGLEVAGLDAAVYSWIGGAVVVAIMGFWWMRQHQAYPPRVSRPLLKESLHYGMRSHFDTFFRVALYRLDFLFIAGFLGAEALGYYAMATAAAELLIAIPDSVNMPLMSILMGDRKNDREVATPMALKLVLITMTISALGIVVLGEVLISVLFGREYLPAYEPLLWLLPGVVGLAVSGILRLYLLGHDRPGIVSVMAGWALLINVLLNLVFIPTLGIAGAAISSSIAYIANAALLFREYSRLSGKKPQETFLLSASEARWISSEVRIWIREAAA